MKERIYIYDRSGNLVNDPERSINYAGQPRWGSMWPKGYGICTFVVPRDIVATWAVKQAYEVIVRDGQRIVYQGRLGNLKRQLSGASEQILVDATGWYVELAERKIRKRWVDTAPVPRVEWPVSGDLQESFPFEKREQFLQMRMSSLDKQDRTTADRYRERYSLPAGTTAWKVTLDWKRRSGEGIDIAIYNIDTAAEEWSVDGTDATGSAIATFATAANIFEFRVGPSSNDDYDSNDYAWIDQVVVYGTMTNFAAPTYTGGEIMQDILYMASTNISADYSDIADPGLVLAPFTTLNDDCETADSVAQRVARYGDASLNTWGLCVWDKTGASDSKAKAKFSYRDVSDYDWYCHLADLSGFEDVEDDGEIYNYITVRYTDDKGITRYYTPTDNASQTDATSITDYGQRDYVYDLGDGDATRAAYVGDRLLTYHKDPLHRMSASITGVIFRKGGVAEPTNRIRAGDRLKVVDFDGGIIYFLRSVNYDADSQSVAVSSDLPPETLPMLLAQQEIGG